MTSARRERLDTPREEQRRLGWRPSYDADTFGVFAEQFARFMGTATFLLYMSGFVFVWITWNTLVPDDLREASYALGVSKWKTIVRIVFPIAMPGIVSGILLSIARVIGETAPVLVLVGYSRSINLDAFHGNMASLPLLIYTELTNPEHAGFLRIWGAALTLIIMVAVINIVAALTRFLATRRR